MNIDEMTDREKSLLLARMLKEDMLPGKYMPVMSPEFKPVDLYNPANMALAWRVMGWAQEGRFGEEWNDWVEHDFIQNISSSPADAQRCWLDKILLLAIEAGLVELDHA